MFDSLLWWSRVRFSMAVKRWVWVHWLLMFSGAGFIAILGFYSYQSSQPYFQTAYSAAPAPLLHRLPDGSSVQLNKNGALQVRFFDRIRTTELVAGVAHLAIDSNQQPFQLRVGPVRVHTHGAQLVATHYPNYVEIQILTGTVQLLVGRWWPEQYSLQAGQQFTWTAPN